MGCLASPINPAFLPHSCHNSQYLNSAQTFLLASLHRSLIQTRVYLDYLQGPATRNKAVKTMVTDRGKKSKVSASTEEDTDHIDNALVLSIESLQEVQEELEKVNEEASEKVLEVEQKFNEVRRPVYEKRNEIIRTIPDFWLNAFLSHPALGELLNHEDQQIFKFIESLHVEDFKDVKSGYSIAFNFKPNPYFEDTKLVKTFTFLDEGTTKIVGTPIKWKEGMGTENGGDCEKKGNKRPPADDSFFTWFSEIQQNAVAGFSDEVADIIKEDLWPNPLKYFNSEPDEEDSDEDEDDDDEGDEEDDDEVDNDDE